MQLNFTLQELCKSETAVKNKIANIPNLEQSNNLMNLIYFILQPVRNKYGAIQVNSGFRSKELNKLVGGVTNSNHLTGSAADIMPLKATFKDVYEYITMVLDYDECYIESNKQGTKWLHVAFRKDGNRFKHNPNYLT